MKKKFYVALLSIFAVFAFSFTCCYANNTTSTAVDGIRNAVGGAENVVEDAGKGIVDGVRNVTGAGENTMNNMSNSTSNSVAGTATNDGNYTATRTTTRSATGTTGMSSTMWTWIIMGIVGIVIIALVWMYAKQNNHSNNSYDE